MTVRLHAPQVRLAALGFGAVNVAAGLMLSASPDRIGDFLQVVDWCGLWLGGVNPYAAPDSLASYPPNALVLLAPLAVPGLAAALHGWVAVNLLLTVVIARLATQLADTGRWPVVFAGLVLALPAFRTLNQFSLAAFAPAIAGFVFATAAPRLAGIAIGLSLMKPQIGGPALLWAVAARRWITAAWAVATVAALTAVFDLRLWAGPWSVSAAHARALWRNQNRPDFLPGVTGLQPWLEWLGLPALVLQAGLLMTLSAGLAWIVWRRREDFDLRFYAAASLVSLLALRHLSYDLMLAIPALAFAWTHPGRVARACAGVASVILVASPPTLWRYVFEPRMIETPLDPLVPLAYPGALLALLAVTMLAGPNARTRCGRPRSCA